ncbi:hypothetical protein NDA11_006310 [Ustilago hordei]|uniref:F-box domain-containing protein n=1 Tax=Ustilago hordei TaxID=120017 RepID=I2FX17_USTHO|nr:uncharacterized protein UHO2_04281 [Ustilago hordei]KAJ1037069.1 hypothetical protein NDA10_005157 [Ustilago hordei]KAJ1573701.1 hypothetical protein NDA15_001976 [Ustilago hordei]KAJ1579426.1 hypothetical protein NDA11_006310 [Ustilago hordei]KAJ1579593.1 hypothetical protein NDA12_002292 [Ustilago hordei]KAJ1598485.1 hypothetical protein NDA14_001662 [Ustilago hordei]
MLGDIPLELQAYILVLLPAKTLVRTLSLTNHHFHNLVEAHIQRYCLRYLGLGCHSANADGAAVLEFEAQRPIDTVTAKHTLQFSHFAPVTPCIHAQRPPLSSAAVFEFAQGSSSRVSTDAERLRGGRSSGRGRGNSVSIGPERTRMGAGPYITTPFQPYLPGLAQNDQHRATQAFVSSSLDLEERVPRRPGLSRNPSSSSSIRSRSRSRSSSTASTSRARAIAQEIANAPYPFLRQNLEAAHRHSLHPNASLGPSTRSHANLATTQQSLEEPLDAYDWAGPPGIRAAPTGLGAGSSARLPRRAADKPACYAFQLEPLDSFESLILTLTARRSIPDVNATIGAILRGEDASGHRLRYSKVLAEGLDRVFREWFKPQASSNSASSSQEPELKTLEFDNTSCTLSIQPHASSRAHVAHPALSSSSHDYLSGPPLSAQYANLASNERVELTFHCEHITINAARLLATLERLEHDVLANQARSGLAMSRLPRIVENVSSMGAGGFPVAAATVNASVGYFMISQPGSAV